MKKSQLRDFMGEEDEMRIVCGWVMLFCFFITDLFIFIFFRV